VAGEAERPGYSQRCANQPDRLDRPDCPVTKW